ncbi:MAG: helix-turn-helix domain-containing protein [Planctomycetes bacterium]|nr:helix-turn-helix domain-containing protein [Planctomycetota bacterium]
MQKRKDVLTTGQVAQICNVAPRTVTKWFDSGQLKGYRIPGSRDRRIPTSELIRFMKAHDIPTDVLEEGKMRVLVIDSDWQNAEDLGKVLKSKRNYDVETAQNSFDAGLIAHKMIPHIIIINLMARDIDANQVCKYVRTSEDLSTTKVIALANNLNDSEAEALQQKGFDTVISDSSDSTAVFNAINEVTAIIY